MNAKLTKRGRVWLGVACAIVVGWAAIAALYAILVGVGSVLGNWSEPLMVTVLILMWVVAALMLGWCLGMICSFFWHGVAEVSAQKRWGAWTLLPILIVISCCGIVTFPLAIWPLLRAIEFGEHWWTGHRWRYFFGLSNEWERDVEETEQ